MQPLMGILWTGGGTSKGSKKEGPECYAIAFILILWAVGSHSTRVVPVLYYVQFRLEGGGREKERSQRKDKDAASIYCTPKALCWVLSWS